VAPSALTGPAARPSGPFGFIDIYFGPCTQGASAHGRRRDRDPLLPVRPEPDLQHDAFKAAGCYRIFVDTASGALDERPALAKVLDQLRPGDTLVVWKLDRLRRSLRHLIDTVAELQRCDIGFRSLQENIDTTTPGGKLIFHIFGALAEFERDLIRQRTLAGLASARARGRKGGRPPSMTPTKLALARQMYDSRQHTLAEISRTLGVSRASIYRHLGQQTDLGAGRPLPRG